MSDEAVPRDIPLGPAERPAPRLGGALLESVNAVRPVRARKPVKTMLLVAAAAVAYPVYALSQLPLRADLKVLPMWWFVPVALLWLGGFILPLVLALLPARGQVLPNEGWAGRAAIGVAAILTLAGLFTFDVPGHTLVPDSTWAAFWHYWWHCVSFSMRIAVPALVAGTVALARVMLVGAARLGAAIGAAGGALGGLTLHGLCPYGGAAHVAAAHGGAVIIGALVGALLFPLVRRLVDRLS